jgi:hypothetical protein
MTRSAILAIACLIGLAACVDTSAIQNFASKSSIISADDAVINGSDAAYSAVLPYMASPAMKTRFPETLSAGPGTPEFDQSKKLAPLAARVLQQYMQLLGQLAGAPTAISSSDVSSIASSLNTLGVTGAQVTPALGATSKLASLVLSGYQQAKLRDIVQQANPFVQTITKFLAQFAEQNATLYDKARIISGDYWADLVKDCELAKARPPASCRATIALANNVHARDETTLKQQIDANQAAAAAFQKIGADHQAIVDSAGKFGSAQLLAILQADEPTLVTAIQDLSKL